MALYRPGQDERDACGIGFVADARGRSSRAIVATALEALCRVRHRGAVAADARTGDGAGVLLPLPRVTLGLGERDGVAHVFCDPARLGDAHAVVEAAAHAEGLEIRRWRSAPVDASVLGDAARATLPAIEQLIVTRPEGVDVEEAERRAFRARRRAEADASQRGLRVYVSSWSFRTITLKALCAADQLAAFYADLADDRTEAWFTIFHQRFATNTTPTWERAQPFRFLAHNGEINTIRGNVALMRGREATLGATDLAPEAILRPVVDTSSSDSGILDGALELLVRGGRDISHAASMLVPAAWEDVIGLPADVAGFFHFHACLMEPWDGPAGLVYSDGRVVGASLDRNGLRPLRVSVCDDGLIAVSSEAGAIPTRGHGRVRRTRLGPGESLLIDPEAGGLIEDAANKTRLALRRPYAEWVEGSLRPSSPGSPVPRPSTDLLPRHVAAGYSKEEFTVVLRPMAVERAEPTSSMGDDTAEPPLSQHRRSVFSYLKQRFAQVTNPPIDHLRERHVMSTSTRLGGRGPLLEESPNAAALREYDTFLLFPDGVDELVGDGAVVLDSTFPASDGPGGLARRLAALQREAEDAVTRGAPNIVVSDRSSDAARVAVPIALAAGAVHHHLIARGTRSRVGVVVDSDEPRDPHGIACLLTNGADMVSPRLALESLAELAHSGRLGGDVQAPAAQANYLATIEDGVRKVMSKMGISTLDSYRCAQIIEAIGLGPDVIETCFPGVSSPLGGVTLDDLAEDALQRHRDAYGERPQLVNPGYVKFKSGGEYHAFNPDVVDSLQQAAGLKGDAAPELSQLLRGGSSDAYGRFARLVNERPPAEPRDLLELVSAASPVPIDEVESASEIVRRFSTGAMSHGALSAEAHETLSRALNLIGGMANTGEGGEAPERFADDRNSRIKQVASGRFGVTPEYLAHADEIQIKMAQGSKPGEGGQLPGKKVSVEIARLRHTVPGVALISPPPHHDIYSIEDLAQLIFDLKQANPTAKVSVKLVASEGVGTIAAGVVKALADVVHISGADGGTGASPLSSIKNAGLPWEIGLADTQQTLVANSLRGRVRLRADGGIKTGRDIVIAALLGADEFSFGTAALVAEGCIMVRTCHRDTCPVGIATQRPDLRAKFPGTPETVARYLLLVAQEARELLSSVGLTSLADAVGRTDLLRQRRGLSARAGRMDLSPLLADVRETESEPQRYTGGVTIQQPRSSLGDRLHDDAIGALEEGREIVELAYEIANSDRSVGSRLGCALAARGEARPGRVRVELNGIAGQSFAAFISDGLELALTGEANDYVGKGMAGGKVVIRPPANDSGDPVLVGNTSLYGATGGSVFVAGRAGERFGVRNSGAVAVVEGAGDHACEYMTAGAVVILGSVGRNLGAGMSGGEAYVYDPEAELETKLNPQLVAAYEPTSGQLASLHRVLERHVAATRSPLGQALLDDWDIHSRLFRRVAPVAEVARLEALFEATAAAAV